MQPTEKRKNLRRTVAYPAFVDFGDGSPVRQCTLCDASQEGAQLTVADPDSLPEEFILALSSDGAARRRCRVAWRSKTQVGVEFLKERRKGPLRTKETSVSAAVLPASEAAETAPLRVGIEPSATLTRVLLPLRDSRGADPTAHLPICAIVARFSWPET